MANFPEDESEDEIVRHGGEPANLEDELYAQQLEEENQRERLAQQNSPQNRIKDAAVDAAKSYAKSAVKNFAKEEAAAAASAAGSAIAILGIILAIGALILVVIFIIYSGCNQGGLTGFGVSALSKISGGLNSLGFSSFPPDVCAAFNGGASGGAGATGTFATTATKIDIVLTSAYRPGSPSADSRGETVDISLRNPKDDFGSSDARINQLIAIIQVSGFVGPQGYIQNEYANPSSGASAGHIHVQFNLMKPDGTTYCDGTVPVYPPKDLVAIPSSIPMSGVSHPQLRPCMLIPVEQIFNLAAGNPPPNP